MKALKMGILGEQSVNDFYREHPDIYAAEVRAIQEERGLTGGQEDYEYASSLWVFRKIREYNGLSILAHPNWIIEGAYNIPPRQYLTFLREQLFDALELINGGDTPPENGEQVAIWHEACCQGCKVPVVGNDDSHGTVNGIWFNIGMTFVLAKSNTRKDLIDALKQGMCVAMERYRGEAPHFYGSRRLVSLFSFLYREYFPIHDEMCAQEGRTMISYLRKDAAASDILRLMKGQISRLQQKYFS